MGEWKEFLNLCIFLETLYMAVERISFSPHCSPQPVSERAQWKRLGWGQGALSGRIDAEGFS